MSKDNLISIEERVKGHFIVVSMHDEWSGEQKSKEQNIKCLTKQFLIYAEGNLLGFFIQ